MGTQASTTSYSYTMDMAVPVIASFDSEGHLKPVYVRLVGTARKIDSCWMQSQFVNTMVFNCKVIVEDRLVPLQLTYHSREHVWTVPPGTR